MEDFNKVCIKATKDVNTANPEARRQAAAMLKCHVMNWLDYQVVSCAIYDYGLKVTKIGQSQIKYELIYQPLPFGKPKEHKTITVRLNTPRECMGRLKDTFISGLVTSVVLDKVNT